MDLRCNGGSMAVQKCGSPCAERKGGLMRTSGIMILSYWEASEIDGILFQTLRRLVVYQIIGQNKQLVGFLNFTLLILLIINYLGYPF